MRFKIKKKLSKVSHFVGLRVKFSQFDSIWLSFPMDYSANSMDLLWTLKIDMYKNDFKAVKHYIPLLLPPSVLALYFWSIIDVFMYITHPNHLLMFCKKKIIYAKYCFWPFSWKLHSYSHIATLKGLYIILLAFLRTHGCKNHLFMVDAYRSLNNLS